MFYPVYVHKDTDSAYGVTFPDFPGCFSAADHLNDLPRLVQEAVEVYFEGESMAVPPPSSPEAWANDDRFQHGYWMLVDIDLSRISAKVVHLDINLPEALVHQMDTAAKSRHIDRSAFFVLAVTREIQAIQESA